MGQNKIKIIGLTGGIATGKTTVKNILIKYGYKVIDADEISREIVKKDKPAYKDIVAFFGINVLNSNDEINREKLGGIIFNKKDLRNKLNEIVHPRVYEAIRKNIYKYIKENEKVIFIDIPLLIEVRKRLEKENIIFDEIWLIYLNKDEQIKRLMNRDGYTFKEAMSRINSQIDIDEKIKYCDIVIDNSRDIEHTKKQLKVALNKNDFM
ncbi:dephospho-CoA kinase [Senegalia massiliensis]|uniref:dephospho-CoA kinase n=1 Tax=Senegalia massiliensis TaxID=1720316 RepID=UPI00102F4313|nr:dephospho-CoA kinase [Senegalia massiliensis]